MTDLHTFSTRGVDVILAAVLLPHGHLLEFAGDVVRGTTVHVPVGVHPILWCSHVRRALFSSLVGGVIALPALPRWMTHLAADLACQLGGGIVVVVPTSTAAATTIGWPGGVAAAAITAAALPAAAAVTTAAVVSVVGAPTFDSVCRRLGGPATKIHAGFEAQELRVQLRDLDWLDPRAHILVVVDYVTKWVEAIPTSSADHNILLRCLKKLFF